MTIQPIHEMSIRPETTPLYPSSVYTFPNLAAVNSYYEGNEGNQFLYRRNGHPNQLVVESRVAELEGAESATLCASGMAAIAQACFAHVKPGESIICTSHLYGGTYAFLEEILRPWGVDVIYADLGDLDTLERLLTPSTSILFGESLANPLLQVTDMAALGDFALRMGLKLFIDNTFATPMLMQPLRFGATLSIHSLTKYLNGHSDVLGGVVVGSAEAVHPVRQFAITFGGTLAPYDAWMTERGLQTFHLRFPAQCENASRIARWLSEHKGIQCVYYPGLPNHPSHATATRVLQGGYGAMVSFEVPGGLDGVDTFLRNLRHIRFAPSLGGVHTTISHPGLTSHRAYTHAQRESLGIRDGLIRLSAGVEPTDVLLADLCQALI